MSRAQKAKARTTAATGAARFSQRGTWARGSSRMAGPPAVALELALAGHQQAEVGRVGFLGRHRAGEAAAVEHGDAVADLQQLFQVLGDENDAGALGARGEDGKSVVAGKRVSGRLDLGGRRHITKKKRTHTQCYGTRED